MSTLFSARFVKNDAVAVCVIVNYFCEKKNDYPFFKNTGKTWNWQNKWNNKVQ